MPSSVLELHGRLNDISTVKATLGLTKLREDFRQKRADLRPSNIHLQQFEATFEAVSRHADQICQWLFADPHFKLWELHDDDVEGKELLHQEIVRLGQNSTETPLLSNMFYIQARPGFGKSVTLAAVIKRLSLDSDSVICYFFFKQGDDATQKSLRALTSLVTQLFDDKHARSEEELVKLTTVLEQIRAAAASNAKDSTNSIVFTSEMLREAIVSIGNALKRRMYLIVDAIDECIDHELDGFVPFLMNLAQIPNFRVMISSRESNDLENLFLGDTSSSDLAAKSKERTSSCIITKKATILNITEERNSTDMEIYLRASLQRIMSHRSVYHQSHLKVETSRIVKTIKQKANGMFTYAAIVIASLEQPSQLTLTQKLKNLPEGMDDLYRQRLEDLSFEEKKLVLVALKFIVWGFGGITTVEIAEHFKRVYEKEYETTNEDNLQSPTNAETLANIDKENTSGHEDDPSAIANGASLQGYDPMSDPEIVETIYHLTKSGRDFFKFSNNQKNIDVVHKTVRDWVENEAERIRKWHETSEAARPKISMSDNGELNVTLSVPPSLISGGRGVSIKLQSERDAQLDIAITLLNSLSNPKFVERYMTLKYVKDDGSEKEILHPKAQTDGDSGANITPTGAQSQRTFSFATHKAEATAFRYESKHLIDHLKRVETLWPKENRQGPKWDLFWQACHEFVKPKCFYPWLAQRLQQQGYSRQGSEIACFKSQPIHEFCVDGLVMMVEFLLVQEKADPDVRELQQNQTPMILARDSEAIIMLLLEHGADKTLLNNGASYLALAATVIVSEGWLKGVIPPMPYLVKVCKILIESGADINQPIPFLSPDDTSTILHAAVAAKSLELFKFVMGRPDVNVHAKDKQGMTCLNWIAFSPNANYPLEISKEMTKMLLEAGADPNNQDFNSGAPLTFAVSLQDKDVVELLLQHGADVNDDNKQGLTALHLAASIVKANRGTEIAESITRLLLMYNADFEKETTVGELPIHRAAFCGYEKVFMILVNEYKKKYGTDQSYLFKKYGEEEKTCFQMAAQNAIGGLAIMKYIVQAATSEQLQDMLLKSNKQKENCLHLAAEAGLVDIIEFLLELGADPTIRSEYGTALDHAVLCWGKLKFEMASYLEVMIEKQNGLEKSVYLLLEKAPYLAKDSKQCLNWAIKRYNEKMINMLTECGHRIDIEDEYGWTSYEYAYAERRMESICDLPGFSSWRDPTRKPKKTAVPCKLVVAETPNVFVVSEDGLNFETVKDYVSGYGLKYENDEPALGIQSNCPTAAHRPIFYWEVTFDDTGEDTSGLSVGFYGGGAAMRGIPGTVGAQGDTFSFWGGGDLMTLRDAKGGITVHSLAPKPFVTQFGLIKWKKGDTIGAGYSMHDGIIFYTHNGRYLGTAYEDIRGRLYPAFGSFTPCKGRVNFGASPFMFEEMREHYKDLE
ncbi:hypothetical protein H072_2973 [Dactylellina haptotyla CBS 200.50]|uniref:B30.2/SPRY domain-containing protein n=1 Tax=Dactylellina haptotyla (strain CBS 200.50) TaxID=1284197 RepID=S8AJE4_DACHA|nr:hypothetical protein H072_2973 [Dactylellina haptotyla CBS 200.50]